MSPILGKPMKLMTLYQEETLIEEFKANHYVTEEKKHQLARSLNVSANMDCLLQVCIQV